MNRSTRLLLQITLILPIGLLVDATPSMSQSDCDRICQGMFETALRWAAQEYETPISAVVPETDGSGFWSPEHGRPRIRLASEVALVEVAQRVGALHPRPASDIWTCEPSYPDMPREGRVLPQPKACALIEGDLHVKVVGLGPVSDSASLIVTVSFPWADRSRTGIQTRVWMVDLARDGSSWMVVRTELFGWS